jgi:hypothetical protein
MPHTSRTGYIDLRSRVVGPVVGNSRDSGCRSGVLGDLCVDSKSSRVWPTGHSFDPYMGIVLLVRSGGIVARHGPTGGEGCLGLVSLSSAVLPTVPCIQRLLRRGQRYAQFGYRRRFSLVEVCIRIRV